MQTDSNTPSYVQDNIFVQLGLVNASEETKMAMLEQMNELIHKRLLVRILEGATEQEREQINTAAGEGEDALFAALLTIAPNYPLYLTEEINTVREEMKAAL